MNKTTVKALLANGVFQRWIDGETLQVRQIFYNTWEDVPTPTFGCLPEDYRIKPKVKPFSPEKMAYHMANGTVILDTNGKEYLISSISTKSVAITPNGSMEEDYCSYEGMTGFKFEDGSPFGVCVN